MTSYILKALRSAATALVMFSGPLKAQTIEGHSTLAERTQPPHFVLNTPFRYTFLEIREHGANDPGLDTADRCVSYVAAVRTPDGRIVEYNLDDLERKGQEEEGILEVSRTSPLIRERQNRGFIGGNAAVIEALQYNIDQNKLAIKKLEDVLNAAGERPDSKSKITCIHPLTS